MSFWDVCEYCGSTDLTFTDGGEDAKGKSLTEIRCEECGDVWDDYSEYYPWW